MVNEDTRLINEEDTRLINEYENLKDTSYQKQEPNSSSNFSSSDSQKNSSKGKTIAAAVGGFVAGTAVGGATIAMAQSSDETVVPEEVVTENQNPEETSNSQETTNVAETLNVTETPTPTQEQVILANDEGIRYAHVNADNFNDAFAQARAQVGAGGVFEYNGKLYGTYYADEWNEMSSEDRVAYQSRVNGITPTHHHSQPPHYHSQPTHSANSYDMADNSQPTPEPVPTNTDMIDVEPVDNEIRVLGVEAVQNPDGQIMNVALLEANGDQALLIDVDNNGIMEVFVHDDNYDNQIQESEIHDISGAGIELTDLMQAQTDYAGGDSLYVANDDMPDYVNDADMTMEV
ncbi:MAG: hypothetical protein K2H60_11660 [Muribaculaceae bacterium]|nr:hypothetical protein [Muribaculaceae bacterium]